MIELVLPVAVFLLGLAIGIASGGEVDEAYEGCNGHHWGEPTRLSEEGEFPPWQLAEYREATVGIDDVVMEEQAIKECQDCAERRLVTTEVGRIPRSRFEDDC